MLLVKIPMGVLKEERRLNWDASSGSRKLTPDDLIKATILVLNQGNRFGEGKPNGIPIT